MKRILLKSSLLTILAFINSTLWSQTNLCGVGATLLTPGSTCTYTTANNSGFTNTPASDCTAGTEDDTGWFRFVDTATSHTVTVDGATGFDAVLGVFSNCTLTTVSGGACVDNTGSDGIETRILTGLTIGTTYFIEVHHFGAGSGTNFQICITAPPTNDNCSGAIVITQQASGFCSTTTGTVGLATNSGVANCTGTADDDVWYVFNAISTTAIIRRTTNGSGLRY